MPRAAIFLQDEAVDLPDLVAKLQAIAQNNPDRRIFVRGDKSNTYGRIMEVMGTITEGGFTKVALLAEQPLPAGAAPASGAGAPPQVRPPAPPPGAAPGAEAAAVPAPAAGAPRPVEDDRCACR